MAWAMVDVVSKLDLRRENKRDMMYLTGLLLRWLADSAALRQRVGDATQSRIAPDAWHLFWDPEILSDPVLTL
ncbi:MAG: hypothetical protein P8Q26_15530 [Ascidiaceihabitans sp.]|nr:hypothetical protein [Ascidiaceihabitans sp.]